jgi:hypothetical protein
MTKRAPKVCTLLFLVTAFAALMTEGDAIASHAAPQAAAAVESCEVTAEADQGEELYKKCGFDSDCSHGKCKSGSCGGCGFDSDCKGWGKCKSGKCGSCGFDSDCKGFGKCKSGKCSGSP